MQLLQDWGRNVSGRREGDDRVAISTLYSRSGKLNFEVFLSFSSWPFLLSLQIGLKAFFFTVLQFKFGNPARLFVSERRRRRREGDRGNFSRCRLISGTKIPPPMTFLPSIDCILHFQAWFPSRVNFINVFTRSFYERRSQKHKKLLDLTVFFVLLGSACVYKSCL